MSNTSDTAHVATCDASSESMFLRTLMFRLAIARLPSSPSLSRWWSG